MAQMMVGKTEEQEYLELLDMIDEQLALCRRTGDRKLEKEMVDTLEQTFSVKPVRLKYFVVEAKNNEKKSVKQKREELKNKYELLYDYPGIIELLDLLASFGGQENDRSEVDRMLLWRYRLDSKALENFELCEAVELLCGELRERKARFLEAPEDDKRLVQLAETYYKFNNTISYFLAATELKRRGTDYVCRENMEEFTNVDTLRELLYPENDIPFILVCDKESDEAEWGIIRYLLGQLGKKVYTIQSPMEFAVEGKIPLAETVAVSFENMARDGDNATVPSIELVCGQESQGDNQPYILERLLDSEMKGGFAVILARGGVLDSLSLTPCLCRNVRNLYDPNEAGAEERMSFGWAGDYLSYISLIHGMDARAMLNRPAECDYSIIVPARNSAYTLRYTLQTCLNQRYAGSFEVVLSDNSTEGNDEVYNLYLEMDDPRIKYYKTPREYNLLKSFEFAVLQSRGEFLFFMGADDGVLPWALDALERIRKEHPNEEVIAWDRGFYAWPGFNGGQENRFIIPGRYERDKILCHYIKRNQYLALVLSDANNMYILPNLYINSGCSRRYLQKILEKTGEFYTGNCQDIYMGMVNMSINDGILCMQYPLTIAGMSNASIGKITTEVHRKLEEENERIRNVGQLAHVGDYCRFGYEKFIQTVSNADLGVYGSLLRLISLGVLPQELFNIMDWKKIFGNLVAALDKTDVLFDKKLHQWRYAAAMQGNEFLEWLDRKLYKPSLIPRQYEEKQEKVIKKTYKEETGENGRGIYDASQYGVTNIAEACQLFERLTGL